MSIQRNVSSMNPAAKGIVGDHAELVGSLLGSWAIGSVVGVCVLGAMKMMVMAAALGL